METEELKGNDLTEKEAVVLEEEFMNNTNDYRLARVLFNPNWVDKIELEKIETTVIKTW